MQVKLLSEDKFVEVIPIDRPGFSYVGEATKGPWNDEPNAFKFSVGDSPCIGFRANLGNWCGYVGSIVRNEYFAEPWGEVTFFSRRQEIDELLGFPYDLFIWTGFDCAHYDDYIPGLFDANIVSRENYKTLEFVVDELHSMVHNKKEI